MNSIWTNHLNFYWFAIKTCRMCRCHTHTHTHTHTHHTHTHTHTHTHPWHICCVILKRKLLLLFPELVFLLIKVTILTQENQLFCWSTNNLRNSKALNYLSLSLSLSFSVPPSRLCWCFSDPYSSGSSLKLSDQSSTDIKNHKAKHERKKERKKERRKEEKKPQNKLLYTQWLMAWWI